ncbi:MAG: MBL fold metallo-hydrolase, partial [Proteobacteria bacterium]|nr:MBL fold metallo-hydrolase [Pseudomonadota bacterium]
MDRPELDYPFDDLPPEGTTREVAPGVRWLQMPLPFALDHINLYLIDDGDSWALVDTGIRGDETQKHWKRIFAEELDGKPISRVIVTHMHPDHIGQAGWICRHFNARLYMTRGEYYYARAIAGDTTGGMQDIAIDFFRQSGLPENILADIKKTGWGNYHKSVEPIPIGFGRLMDNSVLTIGGREWRIVTGSGHCPEHACLLCDEL